MLLEDLPYDLTQEKILIKERDYPTFYMDCLDNYERYFGKEISFVAMLEELEDAPENHFLPGRKVMTCCANDIRFLGFEAINETNYKIKSHDWALVTCKVFHEFSNLSGTDEVILHVTNIEKVNAPEGDDVLPL
jgi:uncharacterized membrane protein YcgQ (UPF0703/DUF1980 family)